MTIDKLLQNNADYARDFKGGLSAKPQQRLAVLTCMDARIDVHRILGLSEGDVHVIRNAGGLVTEDAVRSLLLSQRVLGTEEVLVIQHTACGLLNLAEGELKREIEHEVGRAPDFSFGAFTDLHQSVRDAVRTIREEPFLRDHARGFIFDVETGRLEEVG